MWGFGGESAPYAAELAKPFPSSLGALVTQEVDFDVVVGTLGTRAAFNFFCDVGWAYIPILPPIKFSLGLGYGKVRGRSLHNFTK